MPSSPLRPPSIVRARDIINVSGMAHGPKTTNKAYMNPITSVSLRVQHQYNCAASIPPSDSYLLNHGCCVCPAVSLCMAIVSSVGASLSHAGCMGQVLRAIHPFKYAPSLWFFFALLRAFSSLILKTTWIFEKFFRFQAKFRPSDGPRRAHGWFCRGVTWSPKCSLNVFAQRQKGYV